MVKKYGFRKEEKLKSRKRIDELFAIGKSFSVSPLRVSYKFESSASESRLQAGVTVGKKNFNKAVDRNRIKRLMREAYRLEKNDLKETVTKNNIDGFVFFQYTDKTVQSFETIRQAMIKCLKRLLKTVNENPS